MKLAYLLMSLFMLCACASASQFRCKEINHPISIINGANRTDAYNSVNYIVKNFTELKEKYPSLENSNIQEIYSVSKSHESAQYFCEIWVNFNHGIGSTSICLIKHSTIEAGEFKVSTIIESSH